jgi:5-histidylcysteine sulfoxide synthase
MLFDHMKPPPLDAPSTETIRRYFENSWARYEWLFSGLTHADEVLALQPHPFRNALSFYYGHSAAFYVQKLRMAGLIDAPVDPALDQVLERGVWPKSAGEIKNRQAWPGSETLKGYRRRVFDLVMTLIERTDFSSPITASDPRWALMMAIEHECIHLQTTIPLIRRAPAELVSCPEGWEYGPTVPADSHARWIALPGGEVQLGRDRSDSRYFGWDNEYGAVRRVVEPFAMRSRPITNREMLGFVEEGGYREPGLWRSTEARAWFDEMAPSHPSAWIPQDGGYRYRAIFDEMEMPWDWPVLVNRHEAAAFARWAGARLPTEAEFRHVLDQDLEGPDETLSRTRYNVALRWGSPVPVGYLESAIGPSGIDLLGNVARWAEEDFTALSQDRFRPHPLYEDFSRPWFRGDHGVLLGAGFSATGHLCQVTMMRDFMQNHMDQIAGITLVKA